MSSAKKITSKTKKTTKKTSKIPVKNLATGKTAGRKTIIKKIASEKEPKLQVKGMPQKAKSKKSKTYRNIAMFFVIGAFVMLAFIFYFTFSRLTITIIPRKEMITGEAVITVYDKNKVSQPPSALESAEGVIEQIQLEEKKKYPASGIEVIGEEVTGKVTIVNNYTKNQPLVATTRLLSPDKKLFRIKETVNVPAGGSVVVDVYADKASPEMAIGPTKFTIPGLWAGLQDKIYAQSNKKFVYGQQTKKYIEQVDIDNAFVDIKKALLQKAENKLGASYKGYDQVIYELDENSISSEVDGKVGEETNSFPVSMKANVIVIAFSSQTVEKIASGKLSMMVPDNKELVEFNGDNLKYVLEDYNINQGTASVNLTFFGTMSLREGAEILDPSKILGLNREQLEDYLDNINEISGYDINFSPNFVNKVPKLIDRINIEVK